jgi:hypothetical protein
MSVVRDPRMGLLITEYSEVDRYYKNQNKLPILSSTLQRHEVWQIDKKSS